MEKKKTTTEEIEEVLQEIGKKIEELVEKGKEAGVDVKEEIEKKIKDLKENKTSLEEELKKAKELLKKEYEEKKEEIEPRLKESKGFVLEGLRQLGLAFKSLFGKSKS